MWRRLALHLELGFPLTGTERSLLTLAIERAAKGRDALLSAPFWDSEGESGGGLDWLLASAAIAQPVRPALSRGSQLPGRRRPRHSPNTKSKTPAAAHGPARRSLLPGRSKLLRRFSQSSMPRSSSALPG